MNKEEQIKEFAQRYRKGEFRSVAKQLRWLSKALDTAELRGYGRASNLYAFGKIEKEAEQRRREEAISEAISIFKDLPEDEPMTKNPVILELKQLKTKKEDKGGG